MKDLKRGIGLKGFTMLECTIALTLTALFAASFYSAFRVMNGEMWRSKDYFDTSRSAKNVIDRLARDVQEAAGVVVSYGGNTTGTTCLILKLPSISNTGDPTSISNQFDYVTYRINPLNTTQLLRSVDVLNGTSNREGGVDVTDAVVGRKVNSISFSYAGTSLSSVASGTIPTMKYINAQIIAEGTTLGASQQTQLDSDLMLRNYIT